MQKQINQNYIKNNKIKKIKSMLKKIKKYVYIKFYLIYTIFLFNQIILLGFKK